MKLENSIIESVFLLALFLAAFWLWTLPFQQNHTPFGDVDSSTHFGLGDYMAYKNKAIIDVPYFFSFRYGKNNAGKLWYPPQYHTNQAIFELYGGSREIPAQIYIALMSAAVIFTSYILMRAIYGFLPALLTSTLLLFSSRDISWYILGQYPQVLSFGLVPLFLASLYLYVTKKQTIHLYLGSILIALQFYFHPQAIFVSAIATFFFVVFYFLKEKKIPSNLKPDIKHIVFSILILVLLIAPFYQFPFGKGSIYKNPISAALQQEKPYGRLLYWYGNEKPEGISPSYYQFTEMHGNRFSYLLILLTILGLIFTIYRRNPADLMLLAMFLTLYLVMHSNVFGLGRAERFMEAEAMLLYPIAVIGFFGVLSASTSFFKIENNKKIIKIGTIAVLILFSLFTLGTNAYTQLKGAYAGYGRLTPPQVEAAQWMRANLTEDADVYLVGTAIYTKKKWLQAASFRHMVTDTKPIFPDFSLSDANYAFLDYSELGLLGGQPALDSINAWAIQNIQNATLLYDKGNIRVVKLAE